MQKLQRHLGWESNGCMTLKIIFKSFFNLQLQPTKSKSFLAVDKMQQCILNVLSVSPLKSSIFPYLNRNS